jgi:glutamyl-tRNA reductase
MALDPNKIEVGALVYSASSSPTSFVPCKKIVSIHSSLNAYALSNPGEKEKDIYDRDKFFIEDLDKMKNWYHTKLEALEASLEKAEENNKVFIADHEERLKYRMAEEFEFKELIRKEREKLG